MSSAFYNQIQQQIEDVKLKVCISLSVLSPHNNKLLFQSQLAKMF